jgi:hypothetical protein
VGRSIGWALAGWLAVPALLLPLVAASNPAGIALGAAWSVGTFGLIAFAAVRLPGAASGAASAA